MKKMIGLTLLGFMALSVQAFSINLANEGNMSVDEIVNSGATVVSCETKCPKCILKPQQLGIQYEGQEISDVEFLYFNSHSYAVRLIKEYKKDGICQ